jgi:hypothetical protein
MEFLSVTVALAGAITAIISSVVGLSLQEREKRSKELINSKSATLILRDSEGNIITSKVISGGKLEDIEHIIDQKT